MVNQTVSTTKAASAPRFRKFFPGSISGCDLIFAESFKYAITEPVKVTAPMKMPMKTSAWWMPSSSAGTVCCAAPFASTSKYEFQPTRTAATPTKLCRMAISSGISVIATRFARHSPATAPSAIAARISSVAKGGISRAASATVAISASAMPAMPKTTPARDVRCCDSPARLRMNSSAATRSAAWVVVSADMCSISLSRTCRACAG
jgi:hypothetical protein